MSVGVPKARRATSRTLVGEKISRSTASTSGKVGRAARAGDHVPAPLAVGGVGAVRHPHPVEEVTDRQGQRVRGRGDDAHRVDLGRRDRGAPVGEQLAHRGVELLVAHPARHEQEGVVLALGEPAAQGGRVGEEVRPVRGDEPAGGRHHRAPERERLEHVVAGQLRLGDEHGDLAAVGDDPARHLLGLLDGGGGQDVVVAHVAPELVGEGDGVLGGDEDDGGVHRTIVGAPAPRVAVRCAACASARISRMAIRPVVITGEPVLHQRAQPVEVIDDGIRELVADMFETMDAARGVGLAAPQVGVGLRIFTWQLTNDDGIPPRGVVINPYLTSAKPVVGDPDPHEEVEGCLSVPGESFPLRRGEAATLTGLDLDGSEIRYEATGWFARMLQHEYDHLNGFLYVDRLTGKWARKARKAVKGNGWGVPGPVVDAG